MTMNSGSAQIDHTQCQRKSRKVVYFVSCFLCVFFFDFAPFIFCRVFFILSYSQWSCLHNLIKMLCYNVTLTRRQILLLPRTSALPPTDVFGDESSTISERLRTRPNTRRHIENLHELPRPDQTESAHWFDQQQQYTAINAFFMHFVANKIKS